MSNPWRRHFAVPCFCSSPLLNDNTALLELWSVGQSGSLVRHVFVGECSHESIGSRSAGGIRSVDEIIDVANSVGCVETRL